MIIYKKIKTMNNPLVSVVIPTYGGAEYLPRAIDSVLAQTYPEIEIIVVDDNGLGTPIQKATAEALKPYIDNYRVKYICHEVNKNGSAARNTGANHANGEYIALLDDDDYFYPDNIENHMKAWSQLDNSYGLTYCDVEVHNPDGSVKVNHKTFRGQDLYALMIHKLVIGSSTMVVRKSVWDELHGFDESFKRHQDFEFSARLMAKYKVWATGSLGDNYIILRRNSPKNVQQSLDYIKHYLNKMQPVLAILPQKQQRAIYASNILNAAWGYLRAKQFSKFIKEIWHDNIGFIGYLMIIQRLCTMILHKII